MPSKKKPAISKRASLPRAVDYTRAFSKDWERLEHSGRYDMRRLKAAMLLLIANDAPLGPEWLDHPLKGEWDGNRECHIGGDFLHIYRIAAGDDDHQPLMPMMSRRAHLLPPVGWAPCCA